MTFHPGDPYGNTGAELRRTYYSITGIPTHLYDGGYVRQSGYIDEYSINSSGVRSVHALGMSLSKSIAGSTLTYSGRVSNLESHAFNGFALVFITESHLQDPTYDVVWNFVFRDYGVNKTLSLTGLSSDGFSGTWDIPNSVNINNIQVVAAAYDADTRDPVNGWVYAVQSVCDTCSQANVISLYGSASAGWGLTADNVTSPGPTIIVKKGELVTLDLVSADGATHNFFLDYNGDINPSVGEPKSPDFATSVVYQFNVTAAGNFTYYCQHHEGMMHGNFIVQTAASLLTDLNGDGVVNIVDISIVAKAFNSKPEDPNWTEKADVDKNGVVNILDISKVARDFGKRT